MKKILITGATGYLGSELAKALVSYPGEFEVCILTRPSSKINRLLPIISKIKTCNLGEVELSNYFELGRLDAIIHCATEYGRKNTSRLNLIESNFVFPLNLLDSAVAGGVTAFINIDTMLPTKTSNYSLSKSQFRQWLPSISQEIKIANIRMEHFYGPNDDSSKFVSYVVQSLLNKAEAIPLTAGNQKRDFIYIDDAVNAIITILRATLLDSRDAYVEYELGSGSVISIKEMLEMAKAISGNTKTILKFGAIPYRESEEMELAVDLRALKKLGWSPQYSLDSGLKKMIEIEERHK